MGPTAVRVRQEVDPLRANSFCHEKKLVFPLAIKNFKVN
jgi:hypothetical protein